MRIHVLIYLVILTLTAACSTGDGGGPAGSEDVPVVGDGVADQAAPPAGPPRLHVAGTEWVDPDGNPVFLRGVNLGAWTYHETWISQVGYDLAGRALVMAQEAGYGEEAAAAVVLLDQAGDELEGQGLSWLDGFEQELAADIGADEAAALRASIEQYLPTVRDDSDRPLYQLLETRFGVEARDALIATFMDAWIQEEDIAWLAQTGFNLVRVPIGYRPLTAVSHLAPITEILPNERTFERIERLLDWCETYGLHAVIDIQESPGGHNTYSGPARLYDDPAMQALTVALWEELSRRFIDRDVVAAYSLLAEPFGAPSPEARDAMYDKLVKAIRAKGDDHVLVIHDGFLGMDTLPMPADMGWTNVVYSTHLFEFSADSLAFWEGLVDLFYPFTLEAPFETHGVPYYIGSFSAGKDEPWAYDVAEMLVDYFEAHGWSWSLWTFKRIDDPIAFTLLGETSGYGVLTGHADFDRPDVHRDDLETLMTKMTAYADYPFAPNEALVGALLSGRVPPPRR